MFKQYFTNQKNGLFSFSFFGSENQILHSLLSFLKLSSSIFKHNFCSPNFNQKAPNNTTISHLFTGKKLFFYKTLHPWKIRGCPIKPNPPLTKKSRVMWIVPNSVIYMTTSTFKSKYEELKNASYGPFSTKNSTSLSGSKDMLVWIV